MYTKDISEVIIDGDEAYKTAREFVKVLSPHNLKHIKCRKAGEVPVFQRFQIEAQLDKLHNPIVQLASGGYLVINPTEALVSIDVNSGRATKEKDIEETALKTNLEAAEEIAKQLKMRDLAGLVVVDFIDMYEPQNNIAVEKKMKEALKGDRARIQVAKMSIFGLLEISRQRMHSSFVESNYEVCPYCHGHGVVRTIESGATLVLRALEGECVRNKNCKISVSAPTETAAYLLNQKRRNLAALEEVYGVSIVVSGDMSIKDVSDFKIAKEKNVQKKTNAKDVATTCYEADNVEEDEPDEADDYDSQDEGNVKDERNNYFRKNRRNRHFKNGFRREHRNEAPVTTEPEPKPEKKSWWKKLIG
jgi:ribonuclease E